MARDKLREEGPRACGAPTRRGGECKVAKLPGFPACLRHLPDEMLGAAEQMGYYRCKAQVSVEANERYGERCGNPVVNGGDYCPYHLPKDRWLVPMHRDQQTQVYRIHSQAIREGIDTTTVANPLQVLLELAAEALAFKNEMQMRVQALHADEWRYEGMSGEQIRGEIILYERAIERVTRTLAMITRLGIEERIARVEERKARMIEQAVSMALDKCGATPDVQDKAREIIVKQLLAVE